MPFTIGNVFSGTFASLRKGFLPLLIVTLLLYMGPNLLINLGLRFGMGINMGTLAAFQGSFAAVPIGASLVIYFLTSTHISTVTEITVLTAASQPVKLGTVVKHGLINAIPLFLICLLCVIGWLAGGMLLLIPAFIFGIVFSVVVPAYVAEKPGLFKAFGRSRILTKGRRLGIFGFWCLIAVIFYILMLAIEIPFILPLLRQSEQAVDFSFPVPLLVFMIAGGSLVSVIGMMINATIYSCLRFEKERYTGANVAKVFE